MRDSFHIPYILCVFNSLFFFFSSFLHKTNWFCFRDQTVQYSGIHTIHYTHMDYINALFIDYNKIKAYALYFASNWNTFIPLVFLSGCIHTIHMFNRMQCSFVWVFYVFVEAECKRTRSTMCGDKRCEILCFAHHICHLPPSNMVKIMDHRPTTAIINCFNC